jgi:tetratricopeptide (TPR) repeat protein
VLTTAQAGQNLYIGNNPDNRTGMYRAPDFVRPDPRHEEEDFAREAERLSGRPLRPSEVSSFWMRRAFAFMRDEPLRLLSLLGRKIVLFWNAYEIPDNLDQYFMERYSVVMRLWLPGFGMVAPLGLAGMLLCRRDIRRVWPLYLFAACYFLSVVLFYVFSRYRLPIAPFLLLFAGQACLQLVDLYRRRRLRSLAVGALGIVVVAVAVNAPLVQAYNPSALTNLGAVLIEQGDIDSAESLLRHVIEKRPDYADAHNNLGVVLTRRGKLTEAVNQLREAVRLRPRHSNAYINLGGALRRARDYRGALEALGKAGELDPGNALVWQGRGQVRREMGDYAGAMADLKRAAELDPVSAGIRNDLGIALLGLGRTADALAVLSEGSRLQPAMAEVAFNQGIALERLGRKAEALAAYGRAVALRGDFAEAYNNLGNLLAETGDIEGALSAYRNCLRHWKGEARTAEAVREEVRRLERSGAANR